MTAVEEMLVGPLLAVQRNSRASASLSTGSSEGLGSYSHHDRGGHGFSDTGL